MENEYIKIKEAAELLQVTPTTLRNWDRKGKLKTYRHPMNNYRLYKKSELLSLVKPLENQTDEDN